MTGFAKESYTWGAKCEGGGSLESQIYLPEDRSVYETDLWGKGIG